MNTARPQSGFIAFTSLLVIAAATLAISTSISLLGVSESKNSLSFKKGTEALKISEGCGEEALLRLRDEVSYTGGSLQTENGSCTITVNGTGSNKTIEVVTTLDGIPSYVRKIEITAKRVGNSINLLSWKEIL